MRYFPLILAVVFIGCGTTSWVSVPSDENNVKIEKEIRRQISKPTGELTKADLEKVTSMKLGNNYLTDVRGLDKLLNLTKLDLQSSLLTDAKGLEKLTRLEELNLFNNQLTNVKGLEKLTQLTGLGLNNNKLTSVKGLEKLTKLKVLELHGNTALTKAQIDQLNRALPKCKIYHRHNAKSTTAITREVTALIPPRESP